MQQGKSTVVPELDKVNYNPFVHRMPHRNMLQNNKGLAMLCTDASKETSP